MTAAAGTTLYVVTEHGWEHGNVVGVYTDKALADEVRRMGEGTDVEEFVLDAIPDDVQAAMNREVMRLRKLLGDEPAVPDQPIGVAVDSVKAGDTVHVKGFGVGTVLRDASVGETIAVQMTPTDDRTLPTTCLPGCDWRGHAIHAPGCPNA